MINDKGVSLSTSARLIVKSIFLEMLRRKDFYVLLIIMFLFMMSVIIIGIVGIESKTTGTFLLNLGMTISCLCAHILTVVMGMRQIPDEVDTKTIYPVLAKPIKRAHYFISKWLGCAIFGIISMLILFLIAYIPTPKMESYDSHLLIQTLFMQCCSIAMIAAAAVMFSVILPRAVNILVIALIYLFADAAQVFAGRFSSGTALNQTMLWLFSYIPKFSKLNFITRYTDGIYPVPAGEFGAAFLYAVFFTMFFMVIGIILFERKKL